MKPLLTMIGLWLIAMPLPAVLPEEPIAKQQELQSLRAKIDQLKVEINKTEGYKSQAAGVLRQSELAISEASHMLRELQRQHVVSQKQLDRVYAEMLRVQAEVAASQAKVAELLKKRYQQGHYEAWRLILNQQHPDTIQRDLHYYTYIVKAQQRLASDLQLRLLQLDRLAEEIRQKQIGLKNITLQKQQNRDAWEIEKKHKAAAVASLAQEVKDKKSRLQRMRMDERNLTQLVNKLNRILQEHERKRVREQLAREKADKMAHSTPRQPGQADQQRLPEPATAADTTKSILTANGRTQPFAALKGRLRWPVAGTLVGRFGELRDEGSAWKGLFIRASTGQLVRVIADGRVVFAEWLRGFGNMMIVDHGKGYMSLYGQNESLLKRVGDEVTAGESIATVGDSGGSQEPGVYFEIRQHGKPQNPLQWAPSA